MSTNLLYPCASFILAIITFQVELSRADRPIADSQSFQRQQDFEGASGLRQEVMSYLRQVRNSELIYEINRRLTVPNFRGSARDHQDSLRSDPAVKRLNLNLDASCTSKSKYISDRFVYFSTMTLTLTNMNSGETQEQVFLDSHEGAKCDEIARTINEKMKSRKFSKNVILAGCANGSKLVKVFLNVESNPIGFKPVSAVEIASASACANEAIKWNTQIIME